MKPDNALINKKNVAIKFDFDSSKNFECFDNMTNDIGNYKYATLEQLKSSNYSYETYFYSNWELICFI